MMDSSMQEFGNRVMTVTSKDPETERLALDKVVRNYLATKKRSFPGYVGGFDVLIYEDPMRHYRLYGWTAMVPTKDVIAGRIKAGTMTRNETRDLCGCADPFAVGVIHSVNRPCYTKCGCSLCAAKR